MDLPLRGSGSTADPIRVEDDSEEEERAGGDEATTAGGDQRNPAVPGSRTVQQLRLRLRTLMRVLGLDPEEVLSTHRALRRRFGLGPHPLEAMSTTPWLSPHECRRLQREIEGRSEQENGEELSLILHTIHTDTHNSAFQATPMRRPRGDTSRRWGGWVWHLGGTLTSMGMGGRQRQRRREQASALPPQRAGRPPPLASQWATEAGECSICLDAIAIGQQVSLPPPPLCGSANGGTRGVNGGLLLADRCVSSRVATGITRSASTSGFRSGRAAPSASGEPPRVWRPRRRIRSSAARGAAPARPPLVARARAPQKMPPGGVEPSRIHIMRPQSAKAKGRRFQQEVVATIKAAFPHLRDNDVVSVSMGAGGEDIVLSPAAEEVFAYSVECKNVERLNIWAALEQACGNAPRGKTPILAIRRNRQTPQAVVPWDHFMELVRCQQRAKAERGEEEPPEPPEPPAKRARGDEEEEPPEPPAKRVATGDEEQAAAALVSLRAPPEPWIAELRECAGRMQALLARGPPAAASE